MSPSQKRKIKEELYVQQMIDTINNLKSKNKAATKENKRLLDQLIRVKAELYNRRLPGSPMTKLKRFFQKLKPWYEQE